MGNIRVIMSKEIKDIIRDKVFVIISVLFIFLSIVSVYIGSTTKNAEMRAYFQVIEMLKSQGITQFPDKPEIFILSILKNNIIYTGIAGALAAVFMSFSIFTKEKENGNIKILLSRPVFRDQLITAKILSGLLLITASQILIFTVNLFLITLKGGFMIGISEIEKLGIFMILSVVYMMLFFVFGLMLSINMKTSESVFIAGIIFWIFTSYIVPQLSDTQKSFSYYTNSAQSVVQIPQETNVSKMIEIFSPYAHFEKAGRNVLEDIPETANFSAVEVLVKNVLADSIFIFVPLIILILGAYFAVMHYEVNGYE